MKVFLIRLCVFIMVYLFVINPLLGLYFDRIVMKDSLLRRADEQFSNLDSLHVLILGDSRSMVAVNPLLIPMSFNFSTNGESYLQTYYKVVRILDRNELGVDVIVIPLDLHSFSSFRTERINDPLYWRRYIDFFDLSRRLGPLTSLDVLVDSWFFPYSGYLKPTGVNFEFLTGNRTMQDLNLGFRPLRQHFGSLSSDERNSDAQSMVRRQLEGNDPLDERLLLCFRDIIDLCSNTGVEVVIVSYPITYEYLSVAESTVTRDDIVLATAAVLEEYGNAHFLDYSRLFNSAPEYFNDSNHLNEEGARLLTLRLAEDLEELGLIQYPRLQ
jgi:hypothetical protein